MKRTWSLVETPGQLAKAKKAICASRIIAIDTEYDSFRYFRDKLCLLQVQTGEKTWLIDPLAGLNLSFLGGVLIDPGVLKILHAGDNDIRILKRDYAFAFRNLFDTHRAAYLLGCRQLSLATLLETSSGIVLEKKMQRSRWDLRPLSEEQLDYAARDTAHLTDLYLKLDGELRERGLEREAERIFSEMGEVIWQPRTLDHLGHRKIRGYPTLTAAQKERLQRLYRWRFEKARETDRASFMVVSDQQLFDLSKVENASPGALAASGILSPEKLGRYGAELHRILRVA
jgi:ribonuclease D